LKPALDEIVRTYQVAGGAALNVAYGPTPMLAKNIADGAPADIFFSADGRWMDYLAERRLIRADTRAEIVKNEIVLVKGGGESRPVAIDRAFPIAQAVGAGPLAMCNPDSHPAGRYGKASLQELGLWDAIAGKIVIVENPQIAALMVARGDAPAAVVFATDVQGVNGVTIVGRFSDTPPITYPAAVVADARHSEAAARFLTYLRSPDARTIFDRFGYR
jgi:molybdate transport system substrate-binding protein